MKQLNFRAVICSIVLIVALGTAAVSYGGREGGRVDLLMSFIGSSASAALAGEQRVAGPHVLLYDRAPFDGLPPFPIA